MNINLTKTSLYAIKAVVLLAERKDKTPVSCKTLAKHGSMPEKFLFQIMRTLVTRDVVVSTRGVAGGYMLNREPTNLTLLDIIEAIEGPVAYDNSSHPELSQDVTSTLLHIIDRVTESVRDQLKAVKVSDVAQQEVASSPSSVNVQNVSLAVA